MNNLFPIIGLLIISTIIGAVGALFLKLGSRDFHIKFSVNGFVNVLKNWRLMLGVLCYAGGTAFFIIALKLGDLSIVYPMTSLSYIFITILSIWLLKEKMNKFKWLGIFAIILGVVLVTL